MAETEKPKTGSEQTPAVTPKDPDVVKPEPAPYVYPSQTSKAKVLEGGSTAAAQSSPSSKKESNPAMFIIGCVIICIAIAATYYAYKRRKDPNWKPDYRGWIGKRNEQREPERPETTPE